MLSVKNTFTVSTCISFPVDHSSKTRSCVQSFDSFKASEIDLNVANLVVFVARLREKKIFHGELWREVLRKLKL